MHEVVLHLKQCSLSTTTEWTHGILAGEARRCDGRWEATASPLGDQGHALAKHACTGVEENFMAMMQNMDR